LTEGSFSGVASKGGAPRGRAEGEEDGDARMQIIRDPAQIAELYKSLLKGARQEVQLIMPSANSVRRQKKLGILGLVADMAAKKNVQVRMVVPASEDIVKELQAMDPAVSMRFSQAGAGPKMTFVIVDRAILLSIELKDDSKESFEEATGLALYSGSRPTVNSYISIFERLWSEADTSNKLRVSEKLKDEFINIAAHELRTPIMPILGAANILSAEFASTDNQTIRNSIAIITRNAYKLQKLAVDILQAARIESGNFKLSVSEANLGEIIQRAISDIQSKYSEQARYAAASSGRQDNNSSNLRTLIVRVIGDIDGPGEHALSKTIHFTHPPPPLLQADEQQGRPDAGGLYVRCDADKVEQVISNLLDNAMKFTPEGGAVVVSASMLDGMAVVSVKDEGPGIDPLIRDAMFQKFVTKSENGTGLGLYLAKKIVEAHGGKIWGSNNESGRGATFMFTLPVSPYSTLSRGKAERQQQLPLEMADRSFVSMEIMRRQALQKIDGMKMNLIMARDEAIRRRNEKLEEFQARVEESRKLLIARQEILNRQVDYNKTRRKVDDRIEQGLEGLKKVIEDLMENVVAGEQAIESVSLNPALYEAIRLEVDKVTSTEFFQSIKRQVQECSAISSNNGGRNDGDGGGGNNI
jgi:signal transduction histidine kinase